MSFVRFVVFIGNMPFDGSIKRFVHAVVFKVGGVTTMSGGPPNIITLKCWRC